MNLPPLLILACSTCGYDRDSPVGWAAQNSILFLLGVIFAVLFTIVFIIFNFARKARSAAAARPYVATSDFTPRHS